jgi:uncharacterized Zn finger protein (UPF0148 family)
MTELTCDRCGAPLHSRWVPCPVCQQPFPKGIPMNWPPASLSSQSFPPTTGV